VATRHIILGELLENRIYHNPSCSKSRQALEVLESHRQQFHTIEYLETPPTAEDIAEVCALLGLSPIDIIRTNEKRFRELRMDASDERSDTEWIQLIVDNPVLLQRPIVVINGRAVIGRPPEKVLEILEP
jgi:arsenate reductase